MSTADSTPAPAPWYAAYPAPKSEVVTISREEVLAMLKATPVEKRDFVLVDLRRNDFEVRMRRGTMVLFRG
jgi:arsenical-resistance protein 2